MNGITVVLCCHNSCTRIFPTLLHLSAQQLNGSFPVEFILIDNGSTDDTAVVACQLWKQFQAPYELRIVREDELGLSYARKRAVFEAKFSLILFCDDDNWLDPFYIQRAFDRLNSDSSIGILGGCGTAECEVLSPSWFVGYSKSYAVGEQNLNYSTLNSLKTLYGAGMVLRTEPLKRIYQNGIESLLTGRKGDSLMSGEDTEICIWFVLMGYKLNYDDQLRFRHFIPKGRLSIDYLIRRAVEKGKTEAIFRVYSDRLQSVQPLWLYSRLFYNLALAYRFLVLIMLYLKPRNIDSPIKVAYVKSMLRYRFTNRSGLIDIANRIFSFQFANNMNQP